MSIPWTEKYRPKRVAEVVGNEEAKRQFLNWLRKWERGVPEKKAALLVGPPGCGKTTLVYAAANELGYEVIEMNASDVRTADKIRRIVGSSIREASLFGYRGKIVLFDEVDGISTREDRGGLSAIIEIIKEAKVPIVLTANDPWDPKFRELREQCEVIQFKPIPKRDAVKVLKKICEKEGIVADEKVLETIIERAQGDLRAAINDLQAIAQGKKRITMEDLKGLGDRSKQMDMFEILRRVFTAKTFDQARMVTLNPSFDYEMYFQWIHENIPYQYGSSIEAIAEAYDALSKADVYMGRIRRNQEWSLLPYALELATAGVALVPHKPPYKFVKYSFPQKILLMARTKEFRQKRDALLRELAQRLHISTAKVLTEVLPYLKIIAKKDRRVLDKIATELGTSAKEVLQYLLK